MHKGKMNVVNIAGYGCSSDVLATRQALTPMKYLMFEMLVLSLRDLMSENQSERNEAIEWFHSNEEEYCFSFNSSASAMGTTAEEIRENIVKPAMGGNYTPILRIPKFAKVDKAGVLYEQ